MQCPNGHDASNNWKTFESIPKTSPSLFMLYPYYTQVLFLPYYICFKFAYKKGLNKRLSIHGLLIGGFFTDFLCHSYFFKNVGFLFWGFFFLLVLKLWSFRGFF